MTANCNKFFPELGSPPCVWNYNSSANDVSHCEYLIYLGSCKTLFVAFFEVIFNAIVTAQNHAGYEAEHFEISMKMAEASLLPAVRKAEADTLVVADGTSCRHQIADGAQREAVHVARVLASALA